jgi:hypothetical protein
MAKRRQSGWNTSFTTRAKQQVTAHPMASAAIAAAAGAAAAGAYLWSQRAAA